MQKLTKEIKLNLKKLNDGEMSIKDLEKTVDNAKELYERLIVLRYKFYEKSTSKAIDSKKEKNPSSQQQIHF